ncbi:protein translocase subunit secE/sec61 gamma [Tahibacter aquaticus]|jgi:preprotein translocase subunit SecE|uniref:Protein translocase subunit SecE n=1 Tax=Tahibacter aquaticus TaxID=520092 RepID=A0A4R6Z2S6_9GAMM|nr:preprotein translocase subunit SecE [Tahibacter aquaticus]TDR45917.1 protein translocase subunit secE/sec61 gamma [Tahibacter aquaticus]
MNAKVEQAPGTNAADIAKLTLAAIILIAGIVGFYYFAESAPVLRVLGLLAGFVLAAVVGSATAKGRDLRSFLKESSFELRKVVWPTREETIRTTGVISVVVIIISIILGLIDLLLKVVVMDWLLKL